jgi:homoserine O-acetyltransferase/O-succinyltransferase
MMTKHEHIFSFNEPFELESGATLPGFRLRYTTVGKLNPDRSNIVWVCHALTGRSDFTTWWGKLFSAEGAFDPSRYFIICANILGGCYGSTGPLSVNHESGKPFYHDFPFITNRDGVRAFDELRKHLGFDNVHTLIGGSLGGQQVLEWGILQPGVFERLIPIACNAVHSPWGIAFNEAQRLAIEADPTWKNNDDLAGRNGLKAARATAMLSYRNYATYQLTQLENSPERLDNFRAASYQRYQGEKLANRFNAFTYWTLSKMMDSHDVGRNRASMQQALGEIKSKTLLIGIDSDILFPVEEQLFLFDHISSAELKIISSLYGHDGFLAEFDQLNKAILQFNKQKTTYIAV